MPNGLIVRGVTVGNDSSRCVLACTTKVFDNGSPIEFVGVGSTTLRWFGKLEKVWYCGPSVFRLVTLLCSGCLFLLHLFLLITQHSTSNTLKCILACERRCRQRHRRRHDVVLIIVPLLGTMCGILIHMFVNENIWILNRHLAREVWVAVKPGTSRRCNLRLRSVARVVGRERCGTWSALQPWLADGLETLSPGVVGLGTLSLCWLCKLCRRCSPCLGMSEAEVWLGLVERRKARYRGQSRLREEIGVVKTQRYGSLLTGVLLQRVRQGSPFW